MQTSLFLWSFLTVLGFQFPEATIFRCNNGKIMLKSDATLEVIEAQSNKLRGAIDF